MEIPSRLVVQQVVLVVPLVDGDPHSDNCPKKSIRFFSSTPSSSSQTQSYIMTAINAFVMFCSNDLDFTPWQEDIIKLQIHTSAGGFISDVVA